jgi:hypothetical protein
MNDWAAYMYDRRIIDGEVFRRYRENGDIVNMVIDHRELTKDLGFWRSEEEIRRVAWLHIKDLKKMKAYDAFDMKVESYEVKTGTKHVNEGKKPERADPTKKK